MKQVTETRSARRAVARKPAPTVQLPMQTPTRRTARLFTNGASQAVRLPKEFRMPGTEVRIWKEGERVVMEPVLPKSESLADVIERFYALCPEGLHIERNQPAMQERDWTGVFEPAPVASRKSRRTRIRQ